ncbi:uncharacterized protein LOC100821012 [Brachypodium distachyon]|uniref:F-box domain-containing protein n=1 Tax=Brachypodium distachyon TaxID=15368 RepID=I1HX44_BRADI|nr:uncharacterized protein LOC100821012 [Brachypodium distachyon]XP_024316617.1 uncharacterized protein LOC100821012 [Brachypodium distachyon]KQJ93281.1 hypothetical protein BRADI_3g03607v3 [Brachypodium distachyon]PNT65860.1 hypothetical protein BRADI_3g03607v3 [Brachypodium distachyon]|eukprot:XP_003570917.1 uncharacterized protein LOC100821012 [Brachypodium distachyon]
MAPPPTSHPGAPPQPPFLQVPDELLQDIFLRLPTAADLARASSACAAFRRVIADHKFLRCYRDLHPPPLVGFIGRSFIPAQPPHPSAAAARAFAGIDFSCSSFLPSTAGRRWRQADFFQGRALLASLPVEEKGGRKILVGPQVLDSDYREFLVRDLAVCDPVHRRYVLLPAVPADLAALIRKPDLLDMETFLAPGEDDEDPLSFRVMCLAQCRMNLVLLAFSSSLGGHWRALTFDRLSTQAVASLVRYEPGLSDRQYVHGCFCWQLRFPNKLLVLDVRVMEFSLVDFTPEQRNSRFVIVEAAEGMLGMLSICNRVDSEDGEYWLPYSVLRNNRWQSEKVIPLPIRRWYLMGVAGGYLLLQTTYTTSSQEQLNIGYFSVEIKTLQVELFAGLSRPIFHGRLYAGFPPSLCAPTI